MIAVSIVKGLSKKVVIINDTEAVAQKCSVKKVFLEISQYSQESICPRDFLK